MGRATPPHNINIKHWWQQGKFSIKIMTRKSIKLEEINGSKFFYIYEVKAMYKNELVEVETHLNKKDAEKAVEIISKHLNKLYAGAYIVRRIVFC